MLSSTSSTTASGSESKVDESPEECKLAPGAEQAQFQPTAAEDDVRVFQNKPVDQGTTVKCDEKEEDDDFTMGYSSDLAEKAGFQNGLYPETEEDFKRAEEVLSKELANLSMNDHEEAMFDVVGLRNAKEEDEAFVNAKLAELDQQLRNISGSRKKTYDAACQLNPDYAQSRKFRLAFLRSKRFDPQKAAGQIINHFRVKQKVFPNAPLEFLAREMKFTDLSPDAREFVEAGYAQLLPSKDAAGRFVFFFASGLKKYKTVESLLQAFWYLMTCKSRNEEIQQCGHVAVVYTLGQTDRLEVGIGLYNMIVCAAGIEVSALHWCDATWGMRFFISAQKLYMDNFTRFRLQAHSGTREEVDFGLRTYGINMDDCPVKPDNTLDTTFHNKWLEAQKQYEENISSPAILVPRRFDVLFGRSKRCMQHPGTMRCQLLVEMNFEEYEGEGKVERNLIAEKVVRIIHESGGRFLKWEGDSTTGAWKEVDHDVARAKVTHFFRGFRERKQKRQKQVNMSAPKRGIDSGNKTDMNASTSLPAKVLDSSAFYKKMRAGGMDGSNAESVETESIET